MLKKPYHKNGTVMLVQRWQEAFNKKNNIPPFWVWLKPGVSEGIVIDVDRSKM